MSRQLIEAVLKWWEEHQHDTVASEEDEWNVYDEPPEFVQLALASQPAEQPRGEPVASGGALAWAWRDEVMVAHGMDAMVTTDRHWVDSMLEVGGHEVIPLVPASAAQPKPEQAAGDGVAYTDEDVARCEVAMCSAADPDKITDDLEFNRACVRAVLDEFTRTPRPAVATPAEVTDEYGPEVKVSKRCTNCKAMVSEPYRVQGDSGVDIYCAHPAFAGLEKGRKYIADSCRNTPDWCPATLAAQCQVRKDTQAVEDAGRPTPVAEPYTAEVVAEVVRGEDGENKLSFVVEGGVDALEPGVVLYEIGGLSMPDDGATELYASPSAASEVPRG